MKHCWILLFLVNTLASYQGEALLQDYESENGEGSWWIMESKLEKGIREMEFAELVYIIGITTTGSLTEEDLELLKSRSESVHRKLSHLVSESSQNAEKIQTLASLLSSQSAMEIIDLMEDEEDEEIIWKLILTVIKTQERVGIIKKYYLDQYEPTGGEELLEMELERVLTTLSSAHRLKLNFETLQEVALLKNLFLEKLSEIIAACDSYILASELWIYYYDYSDKDYNIEDGSQNYATRDEATKHQEILTETREFLRAYKEAIVGQENATVEIDAYEGEHTEL